MGAPACQTRKARRGDAIRINTAAPRAALFWHFKKPLMIVEGKMQYLFDEKGRRYLDVSPRAAPVHVSPAVGAHAVLRGGSSRTTCGAHARAHAPVTLQAFAGIVTVSVGHCHPEVVRAVKEQSELLQHTTTIYLNNQIAEYAKELSDRMPGNLKVPHERRRGDWLAASSMPGLLSVLRSRTRVRATQVVYFVNSGSEANDMAMVLARTFTGNWDVLCLRNAYHGMSVATMGTCGQHTWKQPMPQVSVGSHAAWALTRRQPLLTRRVRCERRVARREHRALACTTRSTPTRTAACLATTARRTPGTCRTSSRPPRPARQATRALRARPHGSEVVARREGPGSRLVLRGSPGRGTHAFCPGGVARRWRASSPRPSRAWAAPRRWPTATSQRCTRCVVCACPPKAPCLHARSSAQPWRATRLGGPAHVLLPARALAPGPRRADGARGGRPVHRRRGADWLWAHGHALLGL